MNHLKAILVDSTTLVVGSANFDYFSCHINQELMFVTTDEALVRDFRDRVQASDRAKARRVPLADDFSWRTHWTSIRVQAGYLALLWMNRHI
jgi:phosphatidylserine/phosphatidylglycerophosphate/cardiolipin synthase-like enzyme